MAEAEEEGPMDSLTQNIRDQFLSCKICLDGLKLPKTLPCLHTFCAECMHYYVEHNRIDSRKFCCPICRRQIYIPKNGVEGFPDSFFVASLADMVDSRGQDKYCGICKFRNAKVGASTLCVECKIELCEDCSTAHTAAKVTQEHTQLPLSQGALTARENYCRVHRGETIKYYCETCNSPICLPCTFLDHRGHQIEEIKNVRSTFSQDMSGLVVQSKDSIMLLGQTKTNLVELENELFIRKEAVKTDIRRSVQQIYRTLNEQEAKLMNELDTYYDVLSISRDRQKLERTIVRLERAQDFVEQLLSEDTSPISQIVNRTEAKENLTQALNYELPEVTVHSTKLNHFVHFLPGTFDMHLGSLLRCTGPNTNSITELRHNLPSNKAVYLHTFKSSEGTNFGDILSLGFLPNGDIVVLVSDKKKIKIFNRHGKIKVEFGEDCELLHPSDLAITRNGLIAIADCGDFFVKVFDQFGNNRFGFGGNDVFQLPISLTTDDRGKILVCDQVKQRVTIHRENGDILQEVEISEIQLPQYICCYRNKVFIADCEHNIIAMYNYSENLQFLAKLSTPENNSGEFLDCSGICMDPCGNLLVADTVVDRIHVFNQRGEISTIIPSGKSFLRPTCMAVSLEGMLVVAQQGVDLMEDDMSTRNVTCIYRLIKADI